MQHFIERYLLLKDGATVGVFADAKVFIILSPDGEYCSAAQLDQRKRCLTRFCPTHLGVYVYRTLNFRNRHSARPYLCERFHGRSCTRHTGDKQLRWPLSQRHNTHKVGMWEVLSSHNHSGSIYMCPFGKRVVYYGDALLHPDLVTEAGKTRIAQPVTLAAPLVQAFPCDRQSELLDRVYWPEHLRDVVSHFLLSNEGHHVTGNGGFISTLLVTSNECGARNADAARELFRALEPELHLLLNRSNYPVSSTHAVVAESVDGQTLLLQPKASVGAESPQFEAQIWFSSDLAYAGYAGHQGEDDAAADLRALLRQNCMLTLSGDFFTLYFTPERESTTSSSTSLPRRTIDHQPSSSTSAPASAPKHFDAKGREGGTNTTNNGLLTETQAETEAGLLCPKLKDQRSSWIKKTFHIGLLESALTNDLDSDESDEHSDGPLLGLSVSESRSSRAEESSSSRSRSRLSGDERSHDYDLLSLIVKYRQVAARLVQFREHVVSRRPTTSSSSSLKYKRSPTSSSSSSSHNSSAEYTDVAVGGKHVYHGGSYVIRYNELCEVDDDIHNTPHYHHYQHNHNYHSNHCNHNNHAAEGIVKLVTESGAKLSAYPMPSPEGQEKEEKEVENRGRWQCAMLRGVFPDHTHLTIDLINKTVVHLSPTGSQDTWHLDSFMEKLQLNNNGQNNNQAALPRYFRELLTFLRFASALPAHRSQVLSDMRRAAVVSAAAKARLIRHETIRCIYEKSGENRTSYAAAAVPSSSFLSSSLLSSSPTDNTITCAGSGRYFAATRRTTTMSSEQIQQQPSNTSGIFRFPGEKYLLVHSALKECSRVIEENKKFLSASAQLQ